MKLEPRNGYLPKIKKTVMLSTRRSSSLNLKNAFTER